MRGLAYPVNELENVCMYYQGCAAKKEIEQVHIVCHKTLHIQFKSLVDSNSPFVFTLRGIC